MTGRMAHVPVMLGEVLSILSPRNGGIYCDGTFGAGGYTKAILEAAPSCRVCAIDQDPAAIRRAEPLRAQHKDNLIVLKGRFGNMESLLATIGVRELDGIVLDLGVSSPQLDDPTRGFSFQADGPLDMRMCMDGPNAADLVNEAGEEELAHIIYIYGEERHSRRVARAIVEARKQTPLTTTTQLADIVRRAVPKSRDGLDPATRTFQALRIQVNDELGELDRALKAAEKLLKAGGRLVIVSFHSLEDRRVKKFLKTRSGGDGPSRHLPAAVASPPSFKLLTRRVQKPQTKEITHNRRSRSARLRAAERTDAPPWAKRIAA